MGPQLLEVRINFQSLNVNFKAHERFYEENKENTPSASEIVANIASFVVWIPLGTLLVIVGPHAKPLLITWLTSINMFDRKCFHVTSN